MSTPQVVERDERTVAVENASYRWAYIVLTYALFVDVIYRGLVLREAAWDLLALAIVCGCFSGVYQARQKTLPHDWVMKVVLVSIVAAAIAAVVAFVVAVLGP